MNIVSTSADIKNLCYRLSQEKFICIDTEFIRDKLYYAKLCLLQIGDSKGKGWAVDALANNIDLSPIYTLFLNPKILKVFHAPRQDIEIIFYLMNKIPYPIYDTQSAAMACGFGDSVSYEILVKNILGIKIDKSTRYSDWSVRPLNIKQLEYAIADVTHLSKIYLFLNRQIIKKNRHDWIKEEIEKFYDTNLYQTDPYSIWQKIKIKHKNKINLPVLIEIAALREKIAKKHNIQRNIILKDHLLIKIALSCPNKNSDLKNIKGFPYYEVSNHLKKLILQSVKKGTKNTDINWIPKKGNLISKKPKTTIDMLNILLKYTAEKHNISSKLIGDKKDIEQLAVGIKNTKLLQGWRNDLFGKNALKFINGKIAITSSKNKIILKKL